MEAIISGMLESYEKGQLSRRHLITALAALAGGAKSLHAEESAFKGVGLNHIAIRVTNIPRSRDFYQKLLGLPVIRQGETDCFLGLGSDFLTLFQNQSPGLDHYCIAIDNFNADAVMGSLSRAGLKPRRPAGTDRVYFPDPDGIEVQLSSVSHHA
jgi:catechol 2,3-dioxygenase-like lactoylglutathione lyase family enzyme